MHRYELLDSGNQEKLERFGSYVLIRPCAAAVWKPALPQEKWRAAHGRFSRDDEGNRWQWRTSVPDSWTVETHGITFKVAPTDFGHLGLFPEHSLLWKWAAENISKGTRVLNLFAYSGAATLACARAGAEVCHLDASKGMVSWARENAALNSLQDKPIRWIVDDVLKFLKREETRGRVYDGIILDPPSFGRGNQGEVFKIERDLLPLLARCRALLSKTPRFVALSTHTPGMTPLVMRYVMEEMMQGAPGKIEEGEMVIEGARPLPSGCFARWSC